MEFTSPRPSPLNGEGEPHPDPLHLMEREEYSTPTESIGLCFKDFFRRKSPSPLCGATDNARMAEEGWERS